MDMPVDDDTSIFAVIDDNQPARIIPGVYDLRFDYFETRVMFGRCPKLVMWFTVITMGEYFNCVQLPRYYNISKLMEKPKKWGRFKVGLKSDFVRDYGRLFDIPTRLDRFPMSVFERVIIEAKVRDVTTGSNQREIPKGLRYSVIHEFVRLKK